MATLTIGGILPTATPGVPYRFAPIVAGGGGLNGSAPIYTFSLDAPLPVGFSHCAWTGEIIGVPAAGTFGISGVNQTVTDGYGNSATWALSVGVASRPIASGATVAITDPFPTRNEATPVSFVTIGTPSAGLSMSNGQVTSTLGNGVSGTIVIQATKGARTQTQTLTFTGSSGSVTPTRTAPTYISAASNSYTSNAGGVSASGSTVTLRHRTANGYAGWLNSITGNKLQSLPGWNYGVGSSSSLRFKNAMSVASRATTGNPAQTSTAITGSVDAQYSPNSDGVYSFDNEPANTSFLMLERNDPGSTYYTTTNPSPLTSMQTVASILDEAIANGKTNIFLPNGNPEGRPFYQMEPHLNSGATFTANVTTGFVDGESFGVTGVIGDNGTANMGIAALTKVSGTPAVGQYSVNSSGGYTFNSTTPPVNKWINYSVTTGTTGQARSTLHYWLASSAAVFIDPDTGTNYGFPGALYNRPQIIPIDTWSALVDPASVTANGAGPNAVPKHGTKASSSDTTGIHPSMYGGQLVANAFAATFNAAFPSATSKVQAITDNNWLLATLSAGNTSLNSGTAALPAAMISRLASNNTIRFAIMTTTAIGFASVDASGNITGTFAGLTVTGTVTYATGAYTLTFSAGVPANTNVIAQMDFTNLLANPTLDVSTGTGALPTNVTGTGIPKGWSLTPDTNTVSALAAGTMSMTTSAGSDANGQYYSIKASGFSGTGALTTFQQAVTAPTQRLNPATPDIVRGAGAVRVMPGADGKLYGLYAAPVVAQMQSSAGFDRFGSSGAPYLIANAAGLDGANSVPMSDLNLTSGVFDIPQQTDPLSTAGMTISAIASQILIEYAPGPQSWEVRIYAQALRVRAD